MYVSMYVCIVEHRNWTWLGYHLNQSQSGGLFCAPRIQCGSAKTLTPKPRTGVPQACYTSNTRYGIYRAHSALEPKRFVLGKT